jgi:hypothetical protein
MFKYCKKINENEIQLLNITTKFGSNDIVCKQMLKLLNNENTKIKLEDNIKNSYYIFLNDTIYLSNREKNKTDYQRICVISHECIHSIQNKIIQVVNFVLSNGELLFFAISIICMLYRFNINIVFFTYLLLNIFSIIFRLILEIDATIKSINLCEKYIKNKIDEKESNILIKSYRSKILLFLPIFIVSLSIGKFLRLLFIYLLK